MIKIEWKIIVKYKNKKYYIRNTINLFIIFYLVKTVTNNITKMQINKHENLVFIRIKLEICIY